MRRTVLVCLCAVAPLAAAEFKAGVGRIAITPEKPIYLSGYASRTHPSEGVLHDIWAKALAIEDAHGGRVVFVTTDVVGLPRSISDVVAARVQKQYGLERSHLVLNASHTHTGPLIGKNLDIMFPAAMTPEDIAYVKQYAQELTDKLVTVIGSAVSDLSPANVWLGNGTANFAINRREATQNGVKIGENPSGPTDHDVPVLKVTSPDGKVRAILFGYACHNTTLTGEFYKISGDYAGFAQIDVEKANPGATAMFMQLCGADQNPNPRSELSLAEDHGKELAAEVIRVSTGDLKPVKGRIRTAFQIVELDFAPTTRETFEADLKDPNVFKVRRAKEMLADIDAGHPIRHYPYPVQAIAIGKDVTVVVLGGEVVVGYDLRTKKEFGATGMIVAGYSNDVMAYIPTTKILKEGGYEPVDSMIYYGMPGPWADDVEERIFGGIRSVVKRVRR